MSRTVRSKAVKTKTRIQRFDGYTAQEWRDKAQHWEDRSNVLNRDLAVAQTERKDWEAQARKLDQEKDLAQQMVASQKDLLDQSNEMARQVRLALGAPDGVSLVQEAFHLRNKLAAQVIAADRLEVLLTGIYRGVLDRLAPLTPAD